MKKDMQARASVGYTFTLQIACPDGSHSIDMLHLYLNSTRVSSEMAHVDEFCTKKTPVSRFIVLKPDQMHALVAKT